MNHYSTISERNIYIGAKIFNHLLTKIKSMSNDLKSFKLQLTALLLQNSFYMNDDDDISRDRDNKQ
jgi:hypothetical protein